MAKQNLFSNVYPFTTEMISGYLPSLDVKNKKILTVGSSCDQALNALLFGAKHITVYDINPNTEQFYELKREMILTHSREKLCYEIAKMKGIPFAHDIYSKRLIQKCNPYLQNNENYEVLKKRLEQDDIEFIEGDIFNMQPVLREERYDCIIFSNILQYIEMFAQEEDPYSFLAQNFIEWKKHLNRGGILQLLYLYHFSVYERYKNVISLPVYHLKNVMDALKGIPLDILFFDGLEQGYQDAVVTYTKKR